MDSNSTASNKRILKIFGWIALVSGIFLFLLLASLPSFVSTSWGQKRVLALINKQIEGEVDIQELKISWFGGQKIQGFTLKDSHREPILTINSFSSNASLFHLLWHKLALEDKMQLDSLYAKIVQEEPGKTNLQRALSRKNSTQSNLPVDAEAAKPIIISNVNGQFNFPFIHISGDTKQSDVAGQFHVDLSLNNSSHTIAKVNEGSEVVLKVRIAHFPVDVIDSAASIIKPELSGFIRTALGPELNFSFDESLNGEEISFELNAATASMEAHIVGKAEAGKFILDQPGEIALSITPALMDRLTVLMGSPAIIQLASPVQSKLTINQFSLPFHFRTKQQSGIDLSALAMSAHFDLNEAVLAGNPFVGKITLKGIKASFDAQEHSKRTSFRVDGEASQNGQPIQLKFSGTLDKPSHLTSIFESIKKIADLQVEAIGIPVSNADAILGANSQLIDLLGPSINIKMQAESENGLKDVFVSVSSDKLSIPRLHMHLGDKVSLLEPATIAFNVKAGAVNRYLESLNLQTDVALTLQLNQIEFPLLGFNPSDSIAQAELKLTAPIRVQMSTLGEVRLNSLLLQIDGSSLSDVKINLVGGLTSDNIHPVLGSEMQVALLGQAEILDNGSIDVQSFTLTTQSDVAQAAFQGKILPTAQLLLTEPAYVQLTSHFWELLGLSNIPLSTSQVPIKLEINPFSHHFLNTPLSEIHLGGKVYLDALRAPDDSMTILDQMIIPWEIDGKTNKIAAHMQGSAANGQLDGNLLISNWQKQGAFNFDHVAIDADLNVVKAPIEILSFALPAYDLKNLLGPKFDTQLKISYGSSKGGAVLAIVSQDFNGTFSFDLADSITLSQPATIHYQLTPERFKILRKIDLEQHNSLALASSAGLTININSFNLPLNRFQSPLRHLGFDVNIGLDQLALIDLQSKNKVEYDTIKAHFTSADLAKDISFGVTAGQYSEHSLVDSIVFEGSLANIFTDQELFNFSKMSIALNAKASQFPLRMLCALIGFKAETQSKIDALLGSSVDLDLNAKLLGLNGPLKASIKGHHGKATLDAQLAKGVMTLAQPFSAELAVTPELGRSVLHDIFPLLSGVITAAQPVKISIDPQGFAFPFKEFDIAQIKIGQAMVDLGKIQFNNEGQLGTILSLLNSSAADRLNVWFTPLYFNMDNGLISLARMDMLLMNNYHAAVWGKVDLSKDKVKMMVGLPGSTISHAFNLPPIDDSHMLQLPVRGSTSNASVDRSKAAGQISAFVAQSQGGPQGAILGTFLGLASGTLTEDSPPPPTTNPFPWEESSSSDAQQKETAEPESNERNPLKKIKNGASQFLQSLFK